MTTRRRGVTAPGTLLLAMVVAVVAGRLACRPGRSPPFTETSRRVSSTLRTARAITDDAVAAIDGFVRDDAGAPVSQARVCARLASRDLSSVMLRDPICEATDVRGHYAIILLLPGTISLGAMARDHEPALVEPMFRIELGERRHIDLVVHRGGAELSGVVTDAGGGPIAGAHVEADGLMAETDDQGRYTLWLSRGLSWISAGAFGYATVTRTMELPASVDFALEPGGTLSGIVVDDRGQPVEGARVVAVSSEKSPTSEESAFTGDGGRYTIDRLTAGHYIATVYAPHGYGTSAPTLVGVGRQAEALVHLSPAQQITGRVVVGEAHGPCDTGYVSLFDGVRGVDVPVIEQADGTFRADGVRPGTYFPDAGCRSLHASESQAPIVITHEDVDAVWRVDEALVLRGHVRDHQGRPVARARVRAEPPHGLVIVATTNADGSYSLEGLRPGRYTIEADAPGRSDLDVKAVVELPGAVEQDLVVSGPGGAIHGIVTRRDGKPVPGAQIVFSAPRLSIELQTDDRGGFFHEGVDPDRYTIEVSNHAGVFPLVSGDEVVVTDGGSAEVHVVVDVETGEIHGRVVDGGHPATDAFVAFELENGDGSALGNFDREVLVAADGSFTATDLAAGNYTVRARRKGGSDVVQQHVAVGSSVVLELPPTGAISISARRDGAPADDVTVSVHDPDDPTQMRSEQRHGVHGEIAIADLAPGRYVVTVGEGDAQASREVTVTAGETARLAIDLEPRVTLVGRVVEARSGRPISHASVMVTPQMAAPGDGGWVCITDDAGRFRAADVPRGTVAVRAYLDTAMQGGRTYRAIPHGGSAGEVIDLGDIRITPDPAVSGSSGCTLSVADTPGAPAIVASVDPDGPAARAGLVVGDIVTAIDGVDVTGDHGGDAVPLLAGAPGATIRVAVERGVTTTIVLDP